MVHRSLGLLLAALLLAVPACGPGSPGDGGGPDALPQLPDDDGDGIANEHEGKDENLDSDGDGTPDYQDLDSDDDGIPDSVEAGDDETFTPPADADGDGTPNFRDLDSDDNGINDTTEGAEDLDDDGIYDAGDIDNDDDLLNDSIEIGSDPSNPIDSDGDGDPDFRDFDSDNDFILDFHERANDPDMDNVPSYLDDDSDGDCRSDTIEAGDSILATPPVDTDGDTRPDFQDLDSDADGLTDTIEDANCNGAVDAGETDAANSDTDGDGADDLVESTAGTDPNNASDNPQANGDFVFVVPYEGPTEPTEDDLDFSTNLQIVDVYVLADRSGSMTSELTSIRDNIQTVANNLTCPPGNPDPNCISDIWWGVGTVGYQAAGGQSYTNHLDLQPNPAQLSSAMRIDDPVTGCCQEPTMVAAWSTCTGGGSADAGCNIGSAYGARGSCAGSPAANAGLTGIGFPCFRDNALPVVLIVTDEPPNTGPDTFHCPTPNALCNAANAIGGKLVGIKGSGGGTALDTDLNELATCTGAVDSNNGNAPLVVQGDNANAANAIESAIRLLANGIPLDISANPVDDPGDAVDAVAAFVDHLETLQAGTANCEAGLMEQDSNGDGFPDLYIDVRPGTPVCWKLIPKPNTTVMATEEPQLFQATIEVYGDGVTRLDDRDVYFVVPPTIAEVPID